MPDPAELVGEDAKLVTLARSARARVGAVEGAAVRDGDGRTYAGATVALPSLSVTALQFAVASAVAAGATVLEAAVLVSEASTVDSLGLAAVRDLAADAPVYLVAPNGSVLGAVR
ncbi:MAG: cytidine deaminase [Micromonosporaceae bacterium]|nr:cytidine deaminase [Micromonosporaceae bacterium]